MSSNATPLSAKKPPKRGKKAEKCTPEDWHEIARIVESQKIVSRAFVNTHAYQLAIGGSARYELICGEHELAAKVETESEELTRIAAWSEYCERVGVVRAHWHRLRMRMKMRRAGLDRKEEGHV